MNIEGDPTLNSAIEIKSLGLSYRKQSVLKGLTWEIPRGSICALIGLNGSGKTTLLRILAGLLKADAGSAYILGRKVKHGESIREASFMFEPSPLDKSLTARENLKLRCAALGDPLSRADYLIRRTGLEITSKPVKNYSVGMRKRLELAYALAGDPELLVLDEPFDGVDIRGADTLKEIISSYKAEGKTVLLTEHNFTLIEDVAERFGILYDGKIIADISAEESREKYGDLATAFKTSIDNYERSFTLRN